MSGSSTTQVSELKLEVMTGRWSVKSHGLLLGIVESPIVKSVVPASSLSPSQRSERRRGGD